MLRNHRAHQKSAVASTLDRQLFRARIIFFDQVVGGGRKIIEHVLLFREVAGLVPVFAELATTSNIRHDIDAAAIEPKSPRKLKIWRHANPVAAVSVKQRGVVSVPLHSLSQNDVEGNFCSV